MAILVAAKTSGEPAQANSLPTWNSRQPRLNKNKGMKIRKPVAAAKLTPIKALTKNVESSLMANIF